MTRPLSAASICPACGAISASVGMAERSLEISVSITVASAFMDTILRARTNATKRAHVRASW